MKNTGLRKSLPFLFITMVLLFIPIIVFAYPVPWTTESYRTYAYTDIDGALANSEENFGPLLPITASALSTKPVGSGYFIIGSYAHSEITSSGMTIETRANGYGDVAGRNVADTSFTGIFTASAPLFQYSFSYSGDQDVDRGFTFITIDDLTASTTLFSQNITTDSTNIFAIDTPVGHSIRVYYGMSIGVLDSYPGLASNNLTQSLTYSTAVAPEPVSSILFVTGGALLAGRRFLRRKA